MHPAWSLTAAALALGGCQHLSPPEPAPATPMLGMANPASQFCVQQGGRLRIVRTAQGEVGLCTLPDGREVEEWALFRAHHPTK